MASKLKSSLVACEEKFNKTQRWPAVRPPCYLSGHSLLSEPYVHDSTSLITLSLIMALLKFKPAPKYIPDEIDAALDLSRTQHIGTLFRTRFRRSLSSSWSKRVCSRTRTSFSGRDSAMASASPNELRGAAVLLCIIMLSASGMRGRRVDYSTWMAPLGVGPLMAQQGASS